MREHVWVPAHGVGLGTGTATVMDCRSRRPVRVAPAQLSLFKQRVYVRGVALEREGAYTLVRFSTDLRSLAWVDEVLRDDSPELAA